MLQLGGALALAAATGRPTAAQDAPADYTLRIGTGLVELAPEITIATKTYNGQFPGPLLRFREGRPTVVDVFNDTDTPELLHWHGQFLSAALDGAAEQGSPFIPAHGKQRIAFTPAPAGFRFYHTHLAAGLDLTAGLYNGLAGPAYIEPKHEPGAYDREVFLTLKEFTPVWSRTEMAMDVLAPATVDPALKQAAQAAVIEAAKQGRTQGYEVAYTHFAINGRMLGHGEPIRVKAGERVLFHVLNASASEVRGLALPGHGFEVVALDGNAVPRPATVPVLWLGAAERVSAIVAMQHPGVWIMGDVADEDRNRGMGIVVEYAGAGGKPRWAKPPASRWDYQRFAKPGAVAAAAPDEVIEMTIATDTAVEHGFDRFSINGVSFSMEKMEPRFRLSLGKRYRLRLRNATDDIHPMHLHRHSFELTRIAGESTAGVLKDVAMLGRYQAMEVDFTADQPGLSLFHCHMQSHMDFGLMALFDAS